ncbi:hypothetical protein ABID97_002526 [Variovorax sp. OAS795]|uniref:hypothetical protein n=1 Tax=Variovorax sp. OAS795 TaxID=3034231 RepID=UPI0033965DDC
MKARFVALLPLILVAGRAVACSYIVQTQVSFESGSAALDRSQVIKLSEWLERSYTTFPTYTSASVEVGASGPAPLKAKALAELRATNTVRALRMLLRVDLPVVTVAQAYHSPKNSFGESNDFASLQLYPDVKDLKLPDCNPVPNPGVQR